MTETTKKIIWTVVFGLAAILFLQWHAYHHIDQVPEFLEPMVDYHYDGDYSSGIHGLLMITAGLLTLVRCLWLSEQ